MGTLSVWLFLTCYFQQAHGYSAVVTGLCFLPLSLAIISASAITTRLTTRIGSRPLTVTGFILQVAGMPRRPQRRDQRNGAEPGLTPPAAGRS